MLSILAGLFMAGVFTLLFVAHTTADLFLQPRAWATTKHSDWSSLTKHVALYTLMAFVFSSPLIFMFGLLPMACYWLANGLFHFGVDAITSRMNWRAWEMSQQFPSDSSDAGRYRFHAILWICIDQLAHAWGMVVSFAVLVGILNTMVP